MRPSPAPFPVHPRALPASHTLAAPPAFTRTELCLCGIGHQAPRLFEPIDRAIHKVDDFRAKRKVLTDRPLGKERDEKTQVTLARLAASFAELESAIHAQRSAAPPGRRRPIPPRLVRPGWVALDPVWEEINQRG